MPTNMAAPLMKRCFTGLSRNLKFGFGRICAQKYCTTSSIKHVLFNAELEKEISVKGWVHAVRHHKGVTFLHILDGSGPQHLQVIIPEQLAPELEVAYGSCVKVQGLLKESPGKSQSVELLSSSIDIIGPCNGFEFPFKQRTNHPPQYSRDFLHLRPKTKLFQALLRIRNSASMAVHKFFQKENYVFIHTPILTSSDCEGACEMFKVEPLRSDLLTSAETDTDDDSDSIGQGPEVDSADEQSSGSRPNYFFGQPTYLTVSGQLHLEVMTGALTKVYNFGPTFRAENSRGSFHLSEFYMVEAELAFLDRLEDLLTVMEDLVKFVHKSVTDECSEDLVIFSKFVASPHHMSRVERMMQSPFARISYSDAIELLQTSGENFQYKVSWGCDLKKEHELYLTKAMGNHPVFVTDYPADIKPFYARRNDDCRTVSASDLLVPGVGELCGSSLREERADLLQAAMESQGLMEQLQWYLELRQFGSCPHGGFGLGFERLLLAMLGAPSLKDVIPFPRWPRNCKT